MTAEDWEARYFEKHGRKWDGHWEHLPPRQEEGAEIREPVRAVPRLPAGPNCEPRADEGSTPRAAPGEDAQAAGERTRAATPREAESERPGSSGPSGPKQGQRHISAAAVALDAAEAMARRRGETQTPTDARDTASGVRGYAAQTWQRLRSAAGEWTAAKRKDNAGQEQATAGDGRAGPTVGATARQVRSNPGAHRKGTHNDVAPPPTRPTPSSATPTQADRQQVSAPPARGAPPPRDGQ